jgi:hypothetical protein
MTHQDFHQPDQLGYEKYEGENEEAEERVTNDFAKNVPIKNAHGLKAECNMGREQSFQFSALSYKPKEQRVTVLAHYRMSLVSHDWLGSAIPLPLTAVRVMLITLTDYCFSRRGEE